MKTIVGKITSRRTFIKGEDTLKIGYPWLTYGAIIALEAIVNKRMRVLEFGSGGSTIFWAKKLQKCKILRNQLGMVQEGKTKNKTF